MKIGSVMWKATQALLVTKAEIISTGWLYMWGAKVVIPLQARETVLVKLNNGHPGISRMKSLLED